VQDEDRSSYERAELLWRKTGKSRRRLLAALENSPILCAYGLVRCGCTTPKAYVNPADLPQLAPVPGSGPLQLQEATDSSQGPAVPRGTAGLPGPPSRMLCPLAPLDLRPQASLDVQPQTLVGLPQPGLPPQTPQGMALQTLAGGSAQAPLGVSAQAPVVVPPQTDATEPSVGTLPGRPQRSFSPMRIDNSAVNLRPAGRNRYVLAPVVEVAIGREVDTQQLRTM
jgi:hypothetical protein